jgi:hypothetical protein
MTGIAQIIRRAKVKQDLQTFQDRLQDFDRIFSVGLLKFLLGKLDSHALLFSQVNQMVELNVKFAQMDSKLDNLARPQALGRDRTLITPPAPSRIFTGREDILSELEACFFPADATEDQKCFVLDGLGGSGKTQIALMFIKRHRLR